jgi:peptidoglycan/xylan/chitin deacetylase (PgdA/CDA1 family)
MAHVSYPTAFPSECIGDLIQIARGGMDEIIARKAEVGLHGWNIQGFGQAMILGNPEGPFGALSSDEEANLGEQLNELSAAFASATGKPGEQVYAAGRIDWAKWAKFFVEVILPILLAI